MVYVGQCFVDLLANRLHRHRRTAEKKVNFSKWRWLRENPEAYIRMIAGPFTSKWETHEAEKEWIKEHKENLFNLTPGGDYNPMCDEDPVRRQAAIEKIRVAASKRKLSEETKEKIRQFVKSHPGAWTRMSPEARAIAGAKISKSKKGKPIVLTPEQKEKLRLSRFGRKFSAETRLKISLSMMGKNKKKVS